MYSFKLITSGFFTHSGFSYLFGCLHLKICVKKHNDWKGMSLFSQFSRCSTISILGIDCDKVKDDGITQKLQYRFCFYFVLFENILAENSPKGNRERSLETLGESPLIEKLKPKMWFPPWLHERTGCIWAPECLEVLRACGLPCATRHRHIPRLSSSNIETRPGHVLVTPTYLLSCHIRLVLIFLTCSSSPPLTAKMCVTTFFPGWEFRAHHIFELYIFYFQASWYTSRLVNQKRNYA